jgi:uncharacterized lipoprotein YbaY
MKFLPLAFFTALLVLGMSAGCGHVDTTPDGDQNRVLSGVLVTGVPLPAGAEVMVRLVAAVGADRSQPMGSDIPVARSTPSVADRMLAEQVQELTAPAAGSVPFRIEFAAEDALLRRGVNLEARVSYSGRVRFRTINAHLVTLASASYPQRLVLQVVDR